MEEYREALLDLIYPSKTICYICSGPQKEGSKYSICLDCYNSLPFIGDHTCKKCSLALRPIEDGPECESCKNTSHAFERAISLVKYEKHIKELIYRFKYHRHTYLARTMGAIMGNKLKKEALNIDIIIPIPLYKTRQKQRGFNQAGLLGKYISKETKIPLEEKLLIRKKDTSLMHKLNRWERQENVRDAFKVINREIIANKNILLVDDIFTTGATANASSKVLKEAGAGSINIISFARD